MRSELYMLRDIRSSYLVLLLVSISPVTDVIFIDNVIHIPSLSDCSRLLYKSSQRRFVRLLRRRGSVKRGRSFTRSRSSGRKRNRALFLASSTRFPPVLVPMFNLPVPDKSFSPRRGFTTRWKHNRGRYNTAAAPLPLD